ncbi:hypothetical protein Fcan01_01244 [Folsomia candida]|uniref:Uncharacterized protein n=1 Tax=Folsomia candida TaxID=158441 RepID=A0A226F3N4_FOLCA|nr:hypothetical protein Fcan01_01244 [Folsomia candida]
MDEDDGSLGDNNNNLAFHTGCDKFHPDSLSPKHQRHKPLGKSKSARKYCNTNSILQKSIPLCIIRDAKCRISAIIPSSVSSCLENDNISHSTSPPRDAPSQRRRASWLKSPKFFFMTRNFSHVRILFHFMSSPSSWPGSPSFAPTIAKSISINPEQNTGRDL